VFSRRELVYHRVTFGEPSLWGVKPDRSVFRRYPFHRECWRIRRRREMEDWLRALAIFLALLLGPVLIRLVKWW
jgi:hypothetical protein